MREYKKSRNLQNIMRRKEMVTCSRYRPRVAQRVGRVIALLFLYRDTCRGWVFSSTLRPLFIPGKDPVPILQEAGWVPGPVWTGGISRPNRDSIPDRPANSSVAIPTELTRPTCYETYVCECHCRNIKKSPILIVFVLYKSQPVRSVPAAANQFAIAHFVVLKLTIGS